MAKEKANGGQGGQAPGQGQHAPAQGQRRGEAPAHETRIGRIRATVWRNFSKDHGVWFSVSISRGYKDQNQQWKAANTFGRDDLLVVAEVSRQVFLWIAQQSGSVTPANTGGEGTDTNGTGDVPF